MKRPQRWTGKFRNFRGVAEFVQRQNSRLSNAGWIA
jgi:hypothetical protein